MISEIDSILWLIEDAIFLFLLNHITVLIEGN